MVSIATRSRLALPRKYRFKIFRPNTLSRTTLLKTRRPLALAAAPAAAATAGGVVQLRAAVCDHAGGPQAGPRASVRPSATMAGRRRPGALATRPPLSPLLQPSVSVLLATILLLHSSRASAPAAAVRAWCTSDRDSTHTGASRRRTGRASGTARRTHTRARRGPRRGCPAGMGAARLLLLTLRIIAWLPGRCVRRRRGRDGTDTWRTCNGACGGRRRAAAGGGARESSREVLPCLVGCCAPPAGG